MSLGRTNSRKKKYRQKKTERSTKSILLSYLRIHDKNRQVYIHVLLYPLVANCKPGWENFESVFSELMHFSLPLFFTGNTVFGSLFPISIQLGKQVGAFVPSIIGALSPQGIRVIVRVRIQRQVRYIDNIILILNPMLTRWGYTTTQHGAFSRIDLSSKRLRCGTNICIFSPFVAYFP